MLHFVYKHSPTCSLSARAQMQVHAFRRDHPTVPVDTLDVFRDRARSDAIETETGVRHESPQILLYRDHTVLWHASHTRVTADAMATAWAAAEAAGDPRD